MGGVSRRGFFGAFGALAADKTIRTRPPYAGDETLFGMLCPECSGGCGSACEEAIIRFGDDRIPYLDFSAGGCSDCGKCLSACEAGVLNTPDSFVRGAIRINAARCLSWQGVMCFSCQEPCLERAIVFENMFRPEIRGDACTLCGYCISRCPAGAIEVTA